MSSLLKFLQQSFNFSLSPSQIEAATNLGSFLNSKNRCFVLTGFAGTGKTTMLGGITQYLLSKNRAVRLMSPTGRAAKVISEKTKLEAYTIHKTIYSMDELKEYKETDEDGSETFKYFFELSENEDPVNCVYIVDESSMLSNQYSEGEFFRFGSGELLFDLLRYVDFQNPNIRKQIIFIGDSAQLPPVNMDTSPALDNNYLKNLPFDLSIAKTEMTDVLRQKENSGILNNATVIRDQISEERFNKIQMDTDFSDMKRIKESEISGTYLDFLDKNNGRDGVIIAGTNKSVQSYNQAIRAKIFPSEDTIKPEDKILVVRNNYKYSVLNGEFGIIKEILSDREEINVKLRKTNEEIVVPLMFKDVRVEVADLQGEPVQFNCKIIENQLDSAEPQLTSDEQRALYVHFLIRHKNLSIGMPEFKEALKNDIYFSALQIKYGYAVTCHKAQGGEWDDCIIDFSSSQNKFTAFYFRWCYTALTRCKKTLYYLNEPRLSPASGLVMKTNNTARKKEEIPESDMKKIPKNLDFENNFQYLIYKKVLSVTGSKLSVLSINHNAYAERYIFSTEPENTTIDFYYNNKDTVTSIRVIRSGTDSDELLKELLVIKNQVFVNIQSGQKITFQPHQKHLQEFYDELISKLDSTDVEISDIEHNEFHEKYFFTRNNELAVILFYYDGKDRFKHVSVDEKRSNSPDLMNLIKNTLL